MKKIARTLVVTVLTTVALAVCVQVTTQESFLSPANFAMLATCTGGGGGGC